MWGLARPSFRGAGLSFGGNLTVGGTINVSGQIYGTPAGTTVIGPFSISSTLDDIQSEFKTLEQGGNHITVPNWATAVIFQPQPGSAGTVLFCQQQSGFGDTDGIALSEQFPSMFSLAEAGISSFVLNVPGTVPATMQIIFF
jgi:hypothetical protein